MARSIRTSAIVLAAGSGRRFGGAKQFAAIDGLRPVDMAVQVATDVCDEVVLVLPEGHGWDGPAVDQVVAGGGHRMESVRRGFARIHVATGTVVVHQAAHPLASRTLMRRVVAAVEAGAPGAFPGLRPADVVRRTEGGRAGPLVGRDELVLVQSPTAFRRGVLADALDRGIETLEDTELVARAGYDLTVIDGDPVNMHVTTPRELEIMAELYRLASEDR